MKNTWEGRQRPHIEHITSLFENEVLGAFISGHLVLEAILVQMLETKPSADDNGKYFDWSFRRKIDSAEARNLIDAGMATFLRGVNDIRNRMAHKLDMPLTFEDAFELVRLAASGGVDFSDDSIHSDREASLQCYGIEGIIQEVFQNASQDLLFTLDDDNYLHQFIGIRNA